MNLLGRSFSTTKSCLMCTIPRRIFRCEKDKECERLASQSLLWVFIQTFMHESSPIPCSEDLRQHAKISQEAVYVPLVYADFGKEKNCRQVNASRRMSVTAPDFDKFAMNTKINIQVNDDKEETKRISLRSFNTFHIYERRGVHRRFQRRRPAFYRRD